MSDATPGKMDINEVLRRIASGTVMPMRVSRKRRRRWIRLSTNSRAGM